MDDLVERYLQAIGFWLPERQRPDILAEISEDLQSRIEDQESTLGRPLTSSELEALLRLRGRPVMIANRFRSQQSLIGPLWFPIYVFVLKIVVLCYVLPWVLVSFIIRRVQYPESHWGASLLSSGATLWSVAFAAAGVVTLVFALLQWSDTRTHFLGQWNPRQLPPVRHPNKISLSTVVAELVINVVLLFWWVAYARSPVVFDGPSFNLSFTPVWTWFFWGFLAVILCNIALAVANLRSCHWTRLRAAVRLLLDLTGGVFFCCLMRANLVATLYIASLGPERSLALKSAIHLWMDRCFPIAVIIATITVTVNMMRIVRVSRTDRFTPERAIAMLIVALLSTTVSRGQQIPLGHVPNSSMLSDAKLRTILADRIDVQHKSLGMVVAVTEPGDPRVVAYGRLNQSGLGSYLDSHWRQITLKRAR